MKPRRRRPLWIAAWLVVLALLGAAGWFGWRVWSGADAASDKPTTVAVQRGDIEDTVTATGTLQPRDFVDVGTQVSGQLKKLHVEIGSSVKQGQLLAEIDPTVYQSRVDADRAQFRTQEAQLSDKQSQLVLARQQLVRQQNLMKEEATTTDQLQQAEAAVKSLQAQIDALRAQMQQTESSLRGDEANLNYTKIYAPMPGTVVSMAAKQGQTLNANQQAPIILRIADLSIMTVQAQASEADVPKLKPGMDVYFTTLGGDAKRWYGKLRQVNPTPSVVNNVVLYDALFDVPNPDQALMTQMTAQVFFVAAFAKDAVYVPVAAVRSAREAGEGGGRQRRKGAEGGQSEARKGGGREVGGEQRSFKMATTLESAKGTDAARSDTAGKAEKSDSADNAAPAVERRGASDKAEARKGGRERNADSRGSIANGRGVVRVLKEDGTLERREVEVGLVTRVSAQILSGLEPGEQVVVGGARPAGGGNTGGGAGAGKGGAAKFAPTPRL